MVFSSAIFIFAFLPIVFVIERILPWRRAKNWLLILASFLFYAFGEPVYVFLMLLSCLMNYGFGRLIGRSETGGKGWMTLAVVLNVAMLGFFKYWDFFAFGINALLGPLLPILHIPLPIGISFFTFQAMSYVIDCYRDRSMVQRRLEHVLLYISFFPQLIAGPIVKFHDISKEIAQRSADSQEVAEGICRFICGLSKKLLIANAVGRAADLAFGASAGALNAPAAWAGALCYSLQIYFDFSGYSDMAIGLGRMFGFHFQENFNRPYGADGIKDFWRKWHISLSTWFREYLYIPLGGNRRGSRRTMLNVLLVFLVTGLWHGANWTFVLWGLIHGLFLVLENSKLSPIKGLARHPVLRHIYTLVVVVTAFVLFRADTVGQGFAYIRAMYGGFFAAPQAHQLLMQMLTPLTVVVAIPAALLSALPIPTKLRGERMKLLSYGVCIVLFGLCLLNLSSAGYNPFIYFRF